MFTKDPNVYHSFRTKEASHDAIVEEGLGILCVPGDSSNGEPYEEMPGLDGVVAAKISPLRKARGNPEDEDDNTDEDEDENEVGSSESDLERQPFQRDNGQSAGYGQRHIDDDDDSFGDMNQGDFDVGVTGGYYQVDDLSVSLKEMPTRLCEVYSDNIQLKNKKVNELQVRKTVRTKCFPCAKFIGTMAKFLCPKDEKKITHIQRVILKELGMYNEDKFDEIDRAIVWNTYSKDVINLMSQCRSSVICEIKKAMIPGTTRNLRMT